MLRTCINISMPTLMLVFLFLGNAHASKDNEPINNCCNYEDVNDPVSYEELLHQATYNCRNAKPENIDQNILSILVDIEKKYNVPESVRGMALAAACFESGFNSTAKGDRKFSRNKKTPMAIGILQQWKIYEKTYGTDRADPYSAADGWMRHIVGRFPKVDRICRYRTEKKRWVAAWVAGIRSYKKGGRCLERPKHLKVLNRWHRNIKKSRAKCFKGKSDLDTHCGC